MCASHRIRRYVSSAAKRHQVRSTSACPSAHTATKTMPPGTKNADPAIKPLCTDEAQAGQAAQETAARPPATTACKSLEATHQLHLNPVPLWQETGIAQAPCLRDRRPKSPGNSIWAAAVRDHRCVIANRVEHQVLQRRPTPA